MKSDNLSRRRYEAYYRLLRMELVDDKGNALNWELDKEVLKAADYSYQARLYWVSGWVNNRRLDKFYEGIQSNKYSIWSIPF